MDMAAEDALLGEKELERSRIKEKNERMRSHVKNGEKLMAQFMDFLEAVDNNDPQIGLKFDEKAMKKSALDLMTILFTNCAESGSSGEVASFSGESNGGAETGAAEGGGTEIDSNASEN